VIWENPHWTGRDTSSDTASDSSRDTSSNEETK
jgi:hypothetical protein